LTSIRRWALTVAFCALVACLALPFVSSTATDGYAHATGLQVVMDTPEVAITQPFVLDPSIPKRSKSEVAHDHHLVGVVLAVLLGLGLVLPIVPGEVGRGLTWSCLGLVVVALVLIGVGSRTSPFLSFGETSDLGAGFTAMALVIAIAGTAGAAYAAARGFAELRDQKRRQQGFDTARN
jgi:hypothetical protein